MIEAKFPDRTVFNRGQFYRTILKLLGEQTYPQQMQVDIHAEAAAPKRRRLTRSASESNDDPDLRDAVDAAMQQHGVRVLFVDEAHHMLYGKEGARGSMLQEQLEWLKSLGSQTGVLYVLLGTYDLFNFGKLSGHAVASLSIFPDTSWNERRTVLSFRVRSSNSCDACRWNGPLTVGSRTTGSTSTSAASAVLAS